MQDAWNEKKERRQGSRFGEGQGQGADRQDEAQVVIGSGERTRSLVQLIREQRSEIGRVAKEDDRPRSPGFIINRYGL